MSIDRYYTQSFTVQTYSESSTFPYDLAWTDGATFKGALDTVSSNDRWADSQIVALSSHWIACPTGVSVAKGNRIKYGARTFEVVGIPDPVSLKPGHHQEIYVKEIT